MMIVRFLKIVYTGTESKRMAFVPVQIMPTSISEIGNPEQWLAQASQTLGEFDKHFRASSILKSRKSMNPAFFAVTTANVQTED